jgi:hypothetical protein
VTADGPAAGAVEVETEDAGAHEAMQITAATTAKDERLIDSQEEEVPNIRRRTSHNDRAEPNHTAPY